MAIALATASSTILSDVNCFPVKWKRKSVISSLEVSGVGPTCSPLLCRILGVQPDSTCSIIYDLHISTASEPQNLIPKLNLS